MSQDFINCTTSLQHQSYKVNDRQGGISAGLSQEATGYIDTAAARTIENKYNVFNEYGLMPENGMDFVDGIFSEYLHGNNPSIVYVLETDENGQEVKKESSRTYQSDDGRLQMAEFAGDSDDDLPQIMVSYDSDGINGFDRTATYEFHEGFGYIKTEETFDADGDGTNEVVLSKDYDISKEQGTSKAPNPDYGFFSGIANFAKNFTGGEKTPKEVEVNYTRYHMDWTVTAEINADDAGYNPHTKDHFEYVEINDSYGCNDPQQAYTVWANDLK